LRDDTSGFPVTVRSRIVKLRGVAPAQEVPGTPNAESSIDLVARDEASGLGLYRLVPRTGKTHQLRLHMASLGLPILGDPFWPVLRDPVDDDGKFPRPSRSVSRRGETLELHVNTAGYLPLQLLARSLTFFDPFTGERRTFASSRRLAAWL
jgi:tRNA pseudouridine32 synthase/23S rRNA pseudouridine746 synthase